MWSYDNIFTLMFFFKKHCLKKSHKQNKTKSDSQNIWEIFFFFGYIIYVKREIIDMYDVCIIAIADHFHFFLHT